jgi:hypothetical protein
VKMDRSTFWAVVALSGLGGLLSWLAMEVLW